MSDTLYDPFAYENESSTQEQYVLSSKPMERDSQSASTQLGPGSSFSSSGTSSATPANSGGKLTSLPPQSMNYRPEQSRAIKDENIERSLDMHSIPGLGDIDCIAPDQPAAPTESSQPKSTTHSTSDILLHFGIDDEDLDRLILYPEDQFTSANLPFILQEIRIEKTKRAASAVQSVPCAEPQPTRSMSGMDSQNLSSSVGAGKSILPAADFPNVTAAMPPIPIQMLPPFNRQPLAKVSPVSKELPTMLQDYTSATLSLNSSGGAGKSVPPASDFPNITDAMQPIPIQTLLPSERQPLAKLSPVSKELPTAAMLQDYPPATSSLSSSAGMCQKELPSVVLQPSKVTDYGHTSKYSKGVGDEIAKTSSNRADSGGSGSMLPMHTPNSSRRSRESLQKNVRELKRIVLGLSHAQTMSSVAPSSNARTTQLQMQPKQTPQSIPSSISLPKKDTQVLKSEPPKPVFLKQAEVGCQATLKTEPLPAVYPCVVASQPGLVIVDKNVASGPKDHSETKGQGLTAEQIIKTEKQPVLQTGQSICPSASPATDFPNITDAVQPIPIQTTSKRQPPFSKDLPVALKLQDYASVMLRQFPHTCSLCNIECIDNKEWVSHLNTTLHLQNCKLLQKDATGKDPKPSPSASLQTPQHRHQKVRHGSRSRSRSASPRRHHASGGRREKRSGRSRLPPTSRCKRRSRSSSSSSGSCSSSPKRLSSCRGRGGNWYSPKFRGFRPLSPWWSRERGSQSRRSDKRQSSPRTSEERQSSPRRSDKRRSSPRRSEERKSSPRRSDKRRSSPRKSEERRSSPRRSEERRSSPRRSDKRGSSPRRSEERRSSPRRSEERQSSPRRSEERRSSPRRSDKRQSSPRRSEERRSSPRRSDKRGFSPRRSEERRSSPRRSDKRRSSPRRSEERRSSPRRSEERRSSPRRSEERRSSPRRSEERQSLQKKMSKTAESLANKLLEASAVKSLSTQSELQAVAKMLAPAILVELTNMESSPSSPSSTASSSSFPSAAKKKKFTKKLSQAKPSVQASEASPSAKAKCCKSSPPTMVKLRGIHSSVTRKDVLAAVENYGKTKSCLLFHPTHMAIVCFEKEEDAKKLKSVNSFNVKDTTITVVKEEDTVSQEQKKPLQNVSTPKATTTTTTTGNYIFPQCNMNLPKKTPCLSSGAQQAAISQLTNQKGAAKGSGGENGPTKQMTSENKVQEVEPEVTAKVIEKTTVADFEPKLQAELAKANNAEDAEQMETGEEGVEVSEPMEDGDFVKGQEKKTSSGLVPENSCSLKSLKQRLQDSSEITINLEPNTISVKAEPPAVKSQTQPPPSELSESRSQPSLLTSGPGESTISEPITAGPSGKATKEDGEEPGTETAMDSTEANEEVEKAEVKVEKAALTTSISSADVTSTSAVSNKNKVPVLTSPARSATINITAKPAAVECQNQPSPSERLDNRSQPSLQTSGPVDFTISEPITAGPSAAVASDEPVEEDKDVAMKEDGEKPGVAMDSTDSPDVEKAEVKVEKAALTTSISSADVTSTISEPITAGPSDELVEEDKDCLIDEQNVNMKDFVTNSSSSSKESSRERGERQSSAVSSTGTGCSTRSSKNSKSSSKFAKGSSSSLKSNCESPEAFDSTVHLPQQGHGLKPDCVEGKTVSDEPTVMTRSTRAKRERITKQDASNEKSNTVGMSTRRSTRVGEPQEQNAEKTPKKAEKTPPKGGAPLKKSDSVLREKSKQDDVLDSLKDGLARDDRPTKGRKGKRGRPKKAVKITNIDQDASEKLADEEEATCQMADSVEDDSVGNQSEENKSKNNDQQAKKSGSDTVPPKKVEKEEPDAQVDVEITELQDDLVGNQSEENKSKNNDQQAKKSGSVTVPPKKVEKEEPDAQVDVEITELQLQACDNLDTSVEKEDEKTQESLLETLPPGQPNTETWVTLDEAGDEEEKPQEEQTAKTQTSGKRRHDDDTVERPKRLRPDSRLQLYDASGRKFHDNEVADPNKWGEIAMMRPGWAPHHSPYVNMNTWTATETKSQSKLVTCFAVENPHKSAVFSDVRVTIYDHIEGPWAELEEINKERGPRLMAYLVGPPQVIRVPPPRGYYYQSTPPEPFHKRRRVRKRGKNISVFTTF
ncbi:zinc finger protein 638-like [Centropristis striata]|uniref:zinc finger protein 638-like n=1 Tax=Centropristis striata TaxID=184440 RepID=UPI0027DF4EA7|nr:zinc finger protein 638-like [Centropristis striata]XP_059210788.1 zinc finger protein 638-like [Centropristis striata]XP_059210789.1 zinc finger protein 638-like [Centropristis striata]